MANDDDNPLDVLRLAIPFKDRHKKDNATL